MYFIFLVITIVNINTILLLSKCLDCLIQGYLHALGMARTAQVKRDARIGEAEAKRDSGIKVRKYVSSFYLSCGRFKCKQFGIVFVLGSFG